MNMILITEDDFTDNGRIRLKGRRVKHIREVLRAKEGDELSVGLLGDKIGKGRVNKVGETAVELEDVRLSSSPPPPPALTLILALPRPPMLKRILMAVTTLGVKKIILLNTRRVEQGFWLSPVLKGEKISEQLVLGLEQAVDTIMPEVILAKGFKPFVEDKLSDIIKGTCPLVAHPRAQVACPSLHNRPVTLAVGPEGGFIPYEMEKLETLGFQPVSLGPRVLKVETAVTAFISKLF